MEEGVALVVTGRGDDDDEAARRREGEDEDEEDTTTTTQQRRHEQQQSRDMRARSEYGAGPGGYDYHGGSFGAYMRDKQAKLHAQFQERADSLRRAGLDDDGGDGEGAGLADVLRGCTVMVNGRSTLPQSHVRDLVLRCGGSFVNYECDALTHVIAETLPTAKVAQLRKRRRLRAIDTGAATDGGDVRAGRTGAGSSTSSRVLVENVHWVTTKWLLDSVEANKRMKEAPYMCGCDAQHALSHTHSHMYVCIRPS